jgi:hypothetical protein
MSTGISNGIRDIKFNDNVTITNVAINRKNVSLHITDELYNESDLFYNHLLNITTFSLEDNTNENILNNDSDPYHNPLNIPNNLLTLSFDSIQFFFDNKPNLIFNNYGSNDTFHDYYEFNIRNIYIGNIEGILNTPRFSLNLGRAYYISFNPIITKSNYKGFLKSSLVVYDIKLNPYLEQLPMQLESNEIRLKIIPHIFSSKRFIKFETTKKYDCKYIFLYFNIKLILY